MVTNTKWSNLTLSEMVNLHNTNAPDGPTTKEIEDLVVELIYSFPKNFFGQEEDASEFVLYVYPELRKIIERYNPERGMFEKYLFSVLKTKLKIFNFEKERNHYTQALFESSIAPSMYNGYAVRENPYSLQTPSKLWTLNYVFSVSNSSRRRFYVLFLSLCPYMAYGDIEDVCSIFCFDCKQTLDITKVLKETCKNDIVALEKLKLKRTLYFSKYLLSNNDKDLWIRDRKNREISMFQKRANHKDIGNVLNLSTGTIGNYLYYSRNLLAWIDDIYASWDPQELGINSTLLNRVRSIGYLNSKPLLKVFKPVEEFNVKCN